MFIIPPSSHLSFGRALVFVLLVGSIVPLIAQKTGPRKESDLAPLRTHLITAVAADFEIVKDELRQRSNASGGGTYWLVHLKPRHSGYFGFTHRYNYNDSHYSHVEREFNLNVGSRGCRRGPPSTGSYSRYCVGDTIILPIVINNFTEHEFSFKSRQYTKEENAAFENEAPRPDSGGVNLSPVPNPVEHHLRYVGSNSHKMLHRNGGYTLEAYATFVAERPGRFNLALSSVARSKPPDLSSAWLGLGSVPIIVVARETPVTLLASRHEVRGYSKGYDGREWVSSTSGDAFMTQLIILQPGDRIALKYYSSIRSRETEWRERAGKVRNESLDDAPPPEIMKYPFSLQTQYDFTEWLVDHLPRSVL